MFFFKKPPPQGSEPFHRVQRPFHRVQRFSTGFMAAWPSLPRSTHTPIYNPHVLPLSSFFIEFLPVLQVGWTAAGSHTSTPSPLKPTGHCSTDDMLYIYYTSR